MNFINQSTPLQNSILIVSISEYKHIMYTATYSSANSHISNLPLLIHWWDSPFYSWTFKAFKLYNHQTGQIYGSMGLLKYFPVGQSLTMGHIWLQNIGQSMCHLIKNSECESFVRIIMNVAVTWLKKGCSHSVQQTH